MNLSNYIDADYQHLEHACRIQLKENGKVLDEKELTITAVNPDEHHSYTFISNIDGSVQYFSVAPNSETLEQQPALFLSVHGAGVQAIGQARAYYRANGAVDIIADNAFDPAMYKDRSIIFYGNSTTNSA